MTARIKWYLQSESWRIEESDCQEHHVPLSNIHSPYCLQTRNEIFVLVFLILEEKGLLFASGFIFTRWDACLEFGYWHFWIFLCSKVSRTVGVGKGKAIPLLPWTGLECSSSQIWRQSAHAGGKFVSHKLRPPLPPGNIPGTHFC